MKFELPTPSIECPRSVTTTCSMADAALAHSSVEELDSDDRVRLLGVIDQFRELGVNEDISLPQVGPVSACVNES